MNIKKYSLTAFLIGFLGVNISSAESVGAYERSLASDSSYTHAVQPALGFSQGQFVINLDYEYRVTEHFGFGGNFYFTPDDDSAGYAQILGFAAHSKLHVALGDMDLYARPGFGFAKVDYKKGANNEDSLIIAPIFGVGAIYRIAENVGIGVEYLSTFNWTEDDVPASKHDFLVATQIRF